jgi:hypothetical protein
VNYSEAVKKASGIDVAKYDETDEQELRAEIQKAGHDWE